MNQFNKEVLYAVNAIERLSYADRLTTAAELANAIGAPESFLQRILMNLAKSGIVRVKRGPGGGFSMNYTDLVQYRMLDVFAALGHPVKEMGNARASDRLNNALYDTLNVSVGEFLQ
jgi:DNA-binding IscR family transcriptional regulator